MPYFLIFHLLAAVSGASFGLAVVWAAVGRCHWLPRFLLIAAVVACLIPVPAFDLAVGAVSQAFVIAISLAVVRRLHAVPAAVSEAGPPPANRWLRFSLSDLLRAMLLIASVFALAAYMPTTERQIWWYYAIAGCPFGLATLVGAWAAMSRGRRAMRFVVLCVVAAGIGVAWWYTTLTVGLLVATWICLARRAGLITVSHGIASQRATENRHQRSPPFRAALAKVAIGVLSLPMVLLPLAAYYDMLQDAPIPVEPLPEPNGYDEVLRIAASLAAPPPRSAGGVAGDPEAWIEQHRSEQFARLHAALRHPSGVPIQYALGYHNLSPIQSLRQLSRDLYAEAARQQLAAKTSDVQKTYLDIVELGLVAARGGFIADRLVGTAITGLGVEGLGRIRDELPLNERRALIVALQTNDAAWEPLVKLRDREYAVIDKTLGWVSRIPFALSEDFSPEAGFQRLEQSDHTRSAMIRLLVCHLAIGLYQAERGCPPGKLENLVPDYLHRVPEDPFSGKPLIYKVVSPDYLLYSVNRDGHDDGGRRGSSLAEGDLFLDPAAAN
ncbi:MAG TPA: hypothetical protein VF278_00080 [Pirellulales bacterium]